VPGSARVLFTCSQSVNQRFIEINKNEIERRNSLESRDSEREWSEKSRYEFRVMKQCLIVAYADAGSRAKNTNDSHVNNNDLLESSDFELESRSVSSDSENQALHCQKQMQNMAVITDEHLEYAENYIRELDRADKANSTDYDPDDVQLIALIESYVHRIFSKGVDHIPKLYAKKMGGSKKSAEFFRRKIIFKSALMSDNNSKMMKLISKMSATSSTRDAHKIIENAFRSGESDGRWVYLRANHSDNIYRVDYIQLPES
jgi:hypothetical protein